METGEALDGASRSRLHPKKKRRDRLIRFAEHHPDIVLGFEDEVWWSREAQPQMHAWCEEEPVHLVEKQVPRKEPEAKALACDGLYVPTGNQMLWRFVCGRPVSAVTCLFLVWLTPAFAAQGKRALVLMGDNASWHISQEVRQGIRAHNRSVKQAGGCRLVIGRLPSKSPWLNPIEPKWVHGKRAVAEPVRILAGAELRQRLCAYDTCPLEDLIVQEGC